MGKKSRSRSHLENRAMDPARITVSETAITMFSPWEIPPGTRIASLVDTVGFDTSFDLGGSHCLFLKMTICRSGTLACAFQVTLKFAPFMIVVRVEMVLIIGICSLDLIQAKCLYLDSSEDCYRAEDTTSLIAVPTSNLSGVISWTFVSNLSEPSSGPLRVSLSSSVSGELTTVALMFSWGKVPATLTVPCVSHPGEAAQRIQMSAASGKEPECPFPSGSISWLQCIWHFRRNSSSAYRVLAWGNYSSEHR